MSRWTQTGLCATGLGLAFSLWASCALAQLGSEGSPITTSDYRVDLSQGVVLAGTRVLGLAGAYVAIAEGTDGNSQNAAAPAVRTAYSFDHTDYDLGLGVTFPGAVAGNDLFNSGEKTAVSHAQKAALFLDIAANLQLGRWGVGLSLNYMQFQLAPRGQAPGLTARFGGPRLQVARAFADGQLVLGLGARGTGLRIYEERADGSEGAELFNVEGAALEYGSLWRPNDQPFRLGAAVRSAVFTNNMTTEADRDATGNHVITRNGKTIYLPNEVALPWEISAGLAAQIGRLFNPRWVDPAETLARLERFLRWRELERERQKKQLRARAEQSKQNLDAAQAAVEAEQATEQAIDELRFEQSERALRMKLEGRYREMQRSYLLISSSLTIVGPVLDAVGVESFIEGEVQRSGRKATYSPRLGLESEIVPHWLKVRAGTYGEPTRFESRRARARLHGTMGFDLKLFPWTVFGLFDDDTTWRASAALDGARSYFAWSASVGVWH